MLYERPGTPTAKALTEVHTQLLLALTDIVHLDLSDRPGTEPKHLEMKETESEKHLTDLMKVSDIGVLERGHLLAYLDGAGRPVPLSTASFFLAAGAEQRAGAG